MKTSLVHLRTAALLLVAASPLLLGACSRSTGTTNTIDPSVVEVQQSGATVYRQGSSSSEEYPTVTDVSGMTSSLPTDQSVIPTGSGAGVSDTSIKGSVTITQDADRADAQPGQRVWYTIAVSNQTNIPMSGLTVDNTFPLAKMTIIDPSAGTVSGGRISWTVDTLLPQQTRILRFQGEISKSVTHGDSIVNIVTLQGGKLPVTVTATSEVKIIQKLPQTGAEYTKPLENTNKYLKPYKG